MEFRLLGTVELWADDRTHVLKSRKERLTLACLAYEIGRPVSADVLIDRLWEDHPPLNPRKSLYSLISRLRTTIRNASGPEGPIVRQQTNTYALDADRHSVDTQRYAILAAQARSLADSGGDDQALRLIDEATALWRGEPLSGLTGLWAEGVRTALMHQSLAVAQIRTEISFRRGHFADIVGELASLVAHHPTNELLAEQLMLALYGSGQQAEALRVFQDVRRHLVDELAAEPGHRLNRAHQGILHSTPIADLVPGYAVSASPKPFPLTVPNDLPRQPPLVGREAEMQRIRTLLTRGGGAIGSIVAFEGMAGIGKSALALHMAHELREHFPDGQIYLDLRAHANDQPPMAPAAILATLLRRLGVPASGIPEDADETAALWRSLIADLRMLILLDDVADPGQVIAVLPGTDSPSMLLITSRHHLTGIPEQHHVHLGILPEKDAIALVRQHVGPERATSSRELIELIRICAQLPLAIRLAASRLGSRPSWSIADFNHRLAASNQRLAELYDSTMGITRAFDFSYERLDAAQKTAFRRLGFHFGSGFGPHAAAALTGLSLAKTEYTLETLLNYSLIEEPAAHRYRLHDLLRDYARILATTEESQEQQDLAEDRLIDYYLHATDAADRALYPHRPRIDVATEHAPDALPVWQDRAAVRSWFAMEHTNLLTVAERAWNSGSPHRAALFTNALGGFLDAERDGVVAQSLQERAVAYWRSIRDPQNESQALIDLALTHTYTARYPEAIKAAERSVEIARREGNREILAEGLHQLAIPYGHLGRYNESLSIQREALALRLQGSDIHQRARTQNNLAITLLQLGDHSAALTEFEAARDGFSQTGEERTLALIHNNLGDLHRLAGHHKKAEISYRRALEFSGSHGQMAERAMMQINLAELLRTRGELEAALSLDRQALSLARGTEAKLNEAAALTGIGATLRLMGNLDEAVAHHSLALAMTQHLHAAPREFLALYHLAEDERLLGRLDVAVTRARSALESARDMGNAAYITMAQQLLAELEHQASQP